MCNGEVVRAREKLLIETLAVWIKLSQAKIPDLTFDGRKLVLAWSAGDWDTVKSMCESFLEKTKILVRLV